jgi:predicted ATPase
MVKKYQAKKKNPIQKPYVKSVELLDLPDDESDSYPFSIPAIANLGTLRLHEDVTFLIGENGTGKSTLLEAIALAMGFSEEGGSIDHQFSNTSTVSQLSKHLEVRKGIGKATDGFFLRAESFYNFATFIGERGALDRYGGDLHQKSHGESFLALLMNRFEGNGLYILDEPEAALSPSRQLSALVLMHQLVHNNSQFIIATHSPILMAYPEARIIRFDQDGWTEVEYEKTEHYQVTKYFLDNYKRQLERLLTESTGEDSDD